MAEPSVDKHARRSARQIRSAARLLQKEARRILRRYANRISAEPTDAIRACVAAIDHQRLNDDVPELEREAERLDELLHQHASFARKSALRETIENVVIAVLIALGLRSCFYEPFKIPSGSMMPTLRTGDHIFVNKFRYGIQIPFTSTVVGESLGQIRRGDVIVFRYPLDPSDDYIKRVIGLPGDEVKVLGREVSIKRAGESEFEVLPRKRLDEKCLDETGERIEPRCQLFEETIDGRPHVVRYTSPDDRDEYLGKERVLEVPARHLLVMGDNRNQSHDSLAWKQHVEAVAADEVLKIRDLRDLTTEHTFSVVRPELDGDADDPNHDEVTFLGQHRSESHDLSLEVWRDPSIPARAVFEAITARIPQHRSVLFGELLSPSEATPELARARQVGAAIDALTVGESEHERIAVAFVEPAQALLELHCGRSLCSSPEDLAVRLAAALAEFERDHERSARELMPRPEESSLGAGARYGTNWTDREDVRDHDHEVTFRRLGEDEPSARVRLRVFRKPKVEVDLLQDAALAALGSSSSRATLAPTLGERAWVVERAEGWTFVATDGPRDMSMILECGRAITPNLPAATAVAETVWARVPQAAADRRELKGLLVAADLDRVEVDPRPRLDRSPYDRVAYEATVQGEAHSLELELWRKPPEGLVAKVAEIRHRYDLQPDDSVLPDGGAAQDADSFHFVFAVAESEAVLRMRCWIGLCPKREVALALARRAAATAVDPGNFVDTDAERSRPFVPRGNVKGRAERIWLPLRRFWLPIR